jgi:cyclic pyranopterin phosphate synthase
MNSTILGDKTYLTNFQQLTYKMNDKMDSRNKLTHTDVSGKASMVDVGHKTNQARFATAAGHIKMSLKTIQAVRDNQLQKGDVLAVAQIAGIQAAKLTPTIIPLCHTLILDKVSVRFDLTDEGIEATCMVSCQGKTGVEMEALTGVSVSLLTIYDMCKAIDKKMEIGRITLIKKSKKDI